MTHKAKVLPILVAGAWIVAHSLALSAQGLTISSPAQGARLAAGPDYATDVLGDAWDMKNVEDISSAPFEVIGWDNTFGVNTSGSGSVGGTVTSADANLSFLYRGFHNIINPGRNGRRFPIDSNVYKQIAFKMRSGAAGESPQVYWFHRPFAHPDGDLSGVRFVDPTVSGDKIYVADLTQNKSAGMDWASATEHLVRGLRIDPNSGQSGYQVLFDWVRVTRADNDPSAVSQTISWSGGSGSTTIEVIDAGGTVLTVATGQPAAGSYQWKYGILPPGSYTLRITSGGVPQTRIFTINTPPTVQITDPDETGGEDFATTVLGNPWDMNDANDVPLTVHVTSPSFSGGVFTGTSDSSGDPAVFLLRSGGPINSSRYRYLTYRLNVDPPFDLGLGSVARVFWGSNSVLTGSKDIITFPSVNSYTIDLGSLTSATDGGIEPGGQSTQIWSAAPIRYLRIDPHEFAQARSFHFDDVKLAAMDEAVGGSFLIKFTGSDADGDAATVSLYYDTNNSASDGRTLITSGLALGAGQFNWNTSSVTPGTYYVSADVTDGINTQTSYSSGKVLISGPTPPSIGDEIAVDLGASGLWVLANSGTSQSLLHALSPEEMASGDLDGNGQADLIIDFPGFGVWVWLNNSTWFQLHPANVANIVTGDLDGNGRADVLLDFPGYGIWVWLNNSTWFQLHPMSPTRMVTGDLDGNGRAEAIIDFPGFGIWIWRNNSSWTQLHTSNAASLATGDLDGDGRAEVLIGFPGFGLWVWRNNTFWTQLHTVTPSRMTTGNLDGNSQREAIIDFPGFGLWVWRNNSSWAQLHAQSAQALIAADIDGNGLADVIVDFGASGLWAWMNNANWSQLHVQNPQGLATGNLDGH